jgi:hypothetical protein
MGNLIVFFQNDPFYFETDDSRPMHSGTDIKYFKLLAGKTFFLKFNFAQFFLRFSTWGCPLKVKIFKIIIGANAFLSQLKTWTSLMLNFHKMFHFSIKFWRYDATSNKIILNAKIPNKKISKSEILKKYRTKKCQNEKSQKTPKSQN